MKDSSKFKVHWDLDQMGYLELLRLEDQILLEYENIFRNYVPASPYRKARAVLDREQVKWLAGKIIVGALAQIGRAHV